MSSEIISFLMKKVDMYSKKRTYGSPTCQCYSYATCANLSKADAKSTSNEERRKLMRSTWLGLAFTRFRYLTGFQETVSVIVFSSQYQTILMTYCLWLTDR